MKFLICSDIHGSAHFCKLLMDKIAEEKAEKVIILGDILYHGPRNDLPFGYAPKEVILMLNETKDKLLCVRGNCDAEVDAMVLDFPIMDDFKTISADNTTIFATHGHIYNEMTPPPLSTGDILLCGHTHIPKHENFGSFTYLNPGSVSIPKENSPHSYMTFDGKKFLWKNLETGEVYMEYIL